MAALPTYALNPKTGKLVTVDTPDLSAAFLDKPTDTLYVAVSDDVHALFGNTIARATGTWAKRIVQPKYESFGWLQVESDFTDVDGSAAAVAVTVADEAGNTLVTLQVTSRTPVRVAPFREREIVVTVSSAARVTAVTLASTMEELKQV